MKKIDRDISQDTRLAIELGLRNKMRDWRYTIKWWWPHLQPLLHPACLLHYSVVGKQKLTSFIVQHQKRTLPSSRTPLCLSLSLSFCLSVSVFMLLLKFVERSTWVKCPAIPKNEVDKQAIHSYMFL